MPFGVPQGGCYFQIPLKFVDVELLFFLLTLVFWAIDWVGLEG